MKSSCLGADRNYTKPISHSRDLNNKTEQSSGSCQQAQIPSLKGPAPCIISRERLRLYRPLRKPRCDSNRASTATSWKANTFWVLTHFKIFSSYCYLSLLKGSFLLVRGKLAVFFTGLKDSLPRADRYVLLQTIQIHCTNMTDW